MNNTGRSESSSRLRVLLCAYACEPGKGSEPATGWNMAQQLAREHDVWVITRDNNRNPIESELQNNCPQSLRFAFFDFPDWVKFLKKHVPGGVHIYYLLWLMAVRPLARQLIRTHNIHIFHHITFGSAMTPSLLQGIAPRFILGPIGGLQSAPRTYARFFSWKGKFIEGIRSAVVLIMRHIVMPWNLRHCHAILCVSQLTQKALPRSLLASTYICSQVGVSRHDWEMLAPQAEVAASSPPIFRVLMVGRLVHWKGFAIGLEAFARWIQDRTISNASLDIVGHGPEYPHIRRLIRTFGIESKVRMHGTCTRGAYIDLLQQSSVLLFPSIHEPGAYVVIEAMSAAKPVICMEPGEPANLVGIAGIQIPCDNPERSLSAIVAALHSLYIDAPFAQTLGLSGRSRVGEHFLWDRRADEISTIYRKAVSASLQSEGGIDLRKGTSV